MTVVVTWGRAAGDFVQAALGNPHIGQTSGLQSHWAVSGREREWLWTLSGTNL